MHVIPNFLVAAAANEAPFCANAQLHRSLSSNKKLKQQIAHPAENLFTLLAST
jgi:hypothetical protein